ncbi:hypothetical protein [Nostoc sp. NIES-3756]|nr:hypothetical protein [Nostoc sp. NIES-3756]
MGNNFYNLFRFGFVIKAIALIISPEAIAFFPTRGRRALIN